MTPTPSITAAIVEWAVAGVALGAEESGDLEVVALYPHGVLLAVIDGLGHGPEAALAAREAASILALEPTLPLKELVARCHEGLRKTRGVVMSLATLDERDSTLSWCGVGNVEGILLRGNAGSGQFRASITNLGGVVGYRLPPTRVTSVPISPGDVLLLATDGIRIDFAMAVDVERPPRVIADTVLSRHATDSDDALVLVARYLGAGP